MSFLYELSAAAVERADAAALLRRVVPEIGEQVFESHTREDVDDAAEGAIGEIAVETVDIPTPGIFIINPGRTFKNYRQKVP